MNVVKLNDSAARRLAEIDSECFRAEAWNEGMFLNSFANPFTTILGCTEGDVLVAYLCFTKILDEASIDSLAVLPAYRRRGYAELLLKTVLKEVAAAGVKRIYLEVEITNEAALTLYRKEGFVEQGIRYHYYGQNRHAYVMLRDDGDNASLSKTDVLQNSER